MTLPVDFSEPLRTGKAQILRQHDHGLSIVFPSGIVGIYGDDLSLLADAHGDFFVRSKALRDEAVQRGSKEYMECVVAVYRGPLMEEQDASFRLMTTDDFPLFKANYHLADDSYLFDRLKSGVMEAILVEGEIAGFIGMHQEGTLGMLEVLPPYRRRHLATVLEKHYCRKIMQNGLVPYCDIVHDNKASLALHARLGFSCEDLPVWWLGIK